MYRDIFKKKKSLAELEEEREYNEAEITVLQQQAMKKELEKRNIELSVFKDESGKVSWQRVMNWLKNHG